MAWLSRQIVDYAHTGYVPVVVSDLASRREADLLLIGRGRESGLLGRLRANAYAISPCPVVTI